MYKELLGNNIFKKLKAEIMSKNNKISTEEAKEVGEKLGISWNNFDVEQFRRGMVVELEHGTIDSNTNVTNDDLVMTGKIALAHLNEFKDYYDRLEKMEDEAEAYRNSKE